MRRATSKKPTAADLKRQIKELQAEVARLRNEYRPAMDAFRSSAETVLHEVTEEAAHALLGQAILESIIKDVAYKRLTGGEAKIWLETKWHKRHDFEGTHQEQCEWLGLEPEELNNHFKEIDKYVNKSTGDRAIKLFMQAFEAEKKNKDVA